MTAAMPLEELNSELLLCARYGEDDDLRATLQAGAQVNHADGAGSTALHMACANGHRAAVEILLDAGADFVANQSGNTPLHWAVQNEHESVVALLLERCNSALVLARNSFGKSALTEAFGRGSAAMLNRLLEHRSAASLDEEGAPAASELPGEVDLPSRLSAEVVHAFALRAAAGERAHTVRVRELGSVSAREQPVFTSEAREDQTGTQVWGSALVLARWVAEHRDRLDGRVVCELGAGCGLAGLAAAACTSARAVLLTDLAPDTLANLEHNVGLNDAGLASRVRVRAVDWREPSSWPSDVEVALGADLVYRAEMVPPLLGALWGLLPVGGCFVYAAPSTGRAGATSLARCLLAAGFRVEQHAVPERYLANCLEREDDETFEAFFGELRVLTHTLWVCTKQSPAASRWAYLPSWARATGDGGLPQPADDAAA